MLPNSGLPIKMNKLQNEKKYFLGFFKIFFMTTTTSATQQLKHPVHCFP